MGGTISTRNKHNKNTTTSDDWFLPSRDELNEIYAQLYLYGIGSLNSGTMYWSSSEDNLIWSWGFYFQNLVPTGGNSKNGIYLVRACRAFVSVSPSYNLRDIGPAGGYIFWKSGNNYLEVAPSDCASSVWSNIDALAIGTTGTAIGTGQANTNAIINQVGHTDSAAKLCADLVVIA